MTSKECSHDTSVTVHTLIVDGIVIDLDRCEWGCDGWLLSLLKPNASGISAVHDVTDTDDLVSILMGDPEIHNTVFALLTLLDHRLAYVEEEVKKLKHQLDSGNE